MARLSYKSLFIILFFLLIAIVGLLKLTQKTNPTAAWFNDSWMYRKAISISNTSGSNLTDFQVSLSIGTSALINSGKMQSDCDDIRITDSNGKLLSHWIEENNPGCNQPVDTKIWVKIPFLSTSNSGIYIYYGNSSASNIENGNEIFELFDDFNDNSIDTVKWSYFDNIGGLSTQETGQLLRRSGTPTGNDKWSNFSSNSTFNRYRIEEFRLKINTFSGGELKLATNPNSITFRNSGTGYKWQRYSGSWNQIADSSITTGANFVNVKLVASSTGVSIYENNILTGTEPTVIASGTSPVNLSSENWLNSTTTSIDIDNFFVRKYASAEPTASLQSEELSPAPIAYWKFDEGVGTTVYDSTSNLNNGIFGTGSSAPSWQTEDQCISGKCLKFDGSNDFVSIGDNLDFNYTDTRTFSAWIKTTTTSLANQNIISKNDWNSPYSGWRVELMNAKIRFQYIYSYPSNYLDVRTTNDVISPNQWYHITVTYNNKTVIIYLNGKQVSVTTNTDNLLNSIDNSINTNIGNRHDGYETFSGFIDDIKIYPYSRTAAQIKSDYAAGKAHASSNKGSSTNLGSSNKSGEFLSDGLIAYWKMDENTGTNLADSSGNNNTATLVNSAWTSAKFGVGISFNGSNNYGIASTASFTSSRGTWSAWIKDNGSSDWSDYLSWTSSETNYMRIERTSSGNYVLYSNSNGTGQSITNTACPINNSWQHIVVTFDINDQVKFYCNGQLTGTPRSWSAFIEDNTFRISRRSTDYSNYANAVIDEVRIYNRALSTSEVSQLYNWAPSPIVYWDFNESIGNIVNNKSGIGGTGSWNGNGLHWTKGKYGTAGNFNGIDDYVNVVSLLNPLKSLSQGTVEFWSNKNSLLRQAIFFIGSDGSNYWSILHHDTGKIELTIWEGGLNILNGLTSNTFSGLNHTAITVDGSGVKFYVNGIIQPVTYSIGSSSMNNFFNLQSGATAVRIGMRNLATYENYFKGSLDDFKIYNYARTQKQIVEDMNASHPAGGSPVGSQIGYWKFDEGFGSTANNSGFGGSILNGTFGTGNSSPTWTNNGKFNKALNFDGNNDYIQINDNSSLKPTDGITVSAWVKWNTNGSVWEWIVAKNSDSGAATGYMLAKRQSTDSVGFMINSIDASIPRTSFTTGTWYHLVGTAIAGGTANFYVNGSLVKSTNGVPNPIVHYANSLGINKTFYYASPPLFNGTIDEVKIYNYALTLDEIKLDYNRGSALQLGSLSSGSGNTSPSTAASQEYCLPGDSSICSAPVAQWNFEENIGTTAYDTSGNNLHGIFGAGSSAPSWTTGKQNSGAGLNFDGKQKITVTDNASLKPTTAITAEAWFNASNKSIANQKILSKTEGSGYQLSLNENSACPTSTLCFLININGTYYNASYASSNLSSNTWYHMAGTYDGSTVKLFLNGSNVGTTATITNTISQGAYNMCIGSETDSGNCTSGFFNGKIDQVRIFNYARTPAQIAYDYNRGAPIGHWKFDECQGFIAYDSSGIGNTGSIIIGAGGSQNSLGTCAVGTSAAWTNGASGKLNSSLNFDGVDDYVSIPGNWLSNYQTISFWAKPSSSWASAVGMPVSSLRWSNPDHDGFRFIAGTNQLTFSIYNNNQAEYTYAASVTGTSWHHFTLTWNPTTTNSYLDGKLVDTSIRTNAFSNNTTDTDIGRYNFQDNSYFNGQIDDVRIYNYALTSTQVKTLFNNGAVSFN